MKIVESVISADRQKIYFISSEMKALDGLIAESFSISSVACTGITTVRDVATDLKCIFEILDLLKRESVEPGNLQEYIVNFLSEN